MRIHEIMTESDLSEGPRFNKFGKAVGDVAGMAAKGLGAVGGGIVGAGQAIKKGFQAGRDRVAQAGDAPDAVIDPQTGAPTTAAPGANTASGNGAAPANTSNLAAAPAASNGNPGTTGTAPQTKSPGILKTFANGIKRGFTGKGAALQPTTTPGTTGTAPTGPAANAAAPAATNTTAPANTAAKPDVAGGMSKAAANAAASNTADPAGRIDPTLDNPATQPKPDVAGGMSKAGSNAAANANTNTTTAAPTKPDVAGGMSKAGSNAAANANTTAAPDAKTGAGGGKNQGRLGVPAGKKAVDQAVSTVQKVRSDRRDQVVQYAKQKVNALPDKTAAAPAAGAEAPAGPKGANKRTRVSGEGVERMQQRLSDSVRRQKQKIVAEGIQNGTFSLFRKR
jgi:hypothetical protein